MAKLKQVDLDVFMADAEKVVKVIREKGIEGAEPEAKKFVEKYVEAPDMGPMVPCASCAACYACQVCTNDNVKAISTAGVAAFLG